MSYYNTTTTVNESLAYGIAARDLLTFVLPGQQSYFQQRFASHYSGSQAEASALAAAVVNGEKNNRANDLSGVTTAYPLAGVAGSWRPTNDGTCLTAANTVTPNFGKVKPFAITSSSAYRQQLPGNYQTYQGLLTSQYYADQVDQVRALGAVNSSTRSPSQKEAAFFWANDANGTYRPPGQLLETTQTVTSANLTDSYAIERVFAQVSLALADASIAAWDQKFQTAIDLWRPITAIREDDGSTLTQKDPSWQSLAKETPCFPAWVSGHATFGAAWAAVMEAKFGSTPFTVRTQDPGAVGVTRTFTTFSAAATQMANSRLYLGVHFPFDATDGLATGQGVGQYVAANTLMFTK